MAINCFFNQVVDVASSVWSIELINLDRCEQFSFLFGIELEDSTTVHKRVERWTFTKKRSIELKEYTVFFGLASGSKKIYPFAVSVAVKKIFPSFI